MSNTSLKQLDYWPQLKLKRAIIVKCQDMSSQLVPNLDMDMGIELKRGILIILYQGPQILDHRPLIMLSAHDQI